MKYRTLANVLGLAALAGCSSTPSSRDARPSISFGDAKVDGQVSSVADAAGTPEHVAADAPGRAEAGADGATREVADAPAPAEDGPDAPDELRGGDAAVPELVAAAREVAAESAGALEVATPEVAGRGVDAAADLAVDAPTGGPADAPVSEAARPDACLAESDAAFCRRLAKTCGTFTGTDDCGATRTASCGSCTGVAVCVQNQCTCTSETDAVLCSRTVGSCGRLARTDRCGRLRTIECGACPAGQVCAASLCCTPETDQAFCARAGVACGRAAGTDNCGGARTVADCCDDANACTHDVCGSGTCQHVDVRACGQACAGGGCGVTDSDGDGLNDTWEGNGYIDLDCNGRYDEGTDTPLPEADAGRPNVYVKWDYMELTGSEWGWDHSHQPQAASMQAARDAFARHESVLTFFPQHDAIPENSVVALWPRDAMDASCVGGDAVSLYTLKQQHFPAYLAPAYHYAVFAHYASCDSDEGCARCPEAPKGRGPVAYGPTGIAELPGNDLVVGLGYWFDWLGEIPLGAETGSFLHELGHNLGLRHGGGDDLDRKPNYFSVMNDSYRLGIGVTTSPGPFGLLGNNPGTSFRSDYSDRALGALHEGRLAGGICVDDGSGGLDETRGLAGTDPLDRDVVAFWHGGSRYYAPANGSPINWDVSAPPSVYSAGVFVDISGDGLCSTLEGFDDWERTHPAAGVTRLSHMGTSPACNTGNWSD